MQGQEILGSAAGLEGLNAEVVFYSKQLSGYFPLTYRRRLLRQTAELRVDEHEMSAPVGDVDCRHRLV